MEDADRVLNWLSAQFCFELGLWHSRTLAHYHRIVELLQDSSKHECAKMMAYNVYKALRDGFDTRYALTIPVRRESESLEVPEFLDNEAIQGLFSGPKDNALLETEVRIAGLWLAARLPGTQQLLARLAYENEENMPLPALRARLFLIKQHVRDGDLERAEQEATHGRRLLATLVRGASGSLHTEALSMSLEMAFFHIDIDDLAGCERILSRMADILEDLTTVVSVYGRAPVDEKLLDFIKYLLHAGLAYQRREMMGHATSWVERACSIISRMVSAGHPLRGLIETSVHDHHCDEGALLEYDDLRDMVDVSP